MRARAPVRVQWKTLHHRYHVGNPLDATPAEHAEAPRRLERLLDFLPPSAILIDPPFADKWDAIDKLVKHLVESQSVVEPRTGIVDSVKTREKESTTCIGHGLMIPHGTLYQETRLVGVMALSKEGWDFEAPDGEPIRCVVLLATPEGEASRHLAVLAAFARLFMRAPELKNALLDASSPTEAWELLNSDAAQAINYTFESRN